jgi:hypothetical protein
MDARPHHSATRAIEDMRLQLVADRLLRCGSLRADAAFDDDEPFHRVLAERGLLGLDLEGVRREARQQRRHAHEQARVAIEQRGATAAQLARTVSQIDRVARPARSDRSATAAGGSARPA